MKVIQFVWESAGTEVTVDVDKILAIAARDGVTRIYTVVPNNNGFPFSFDTKTDAESIKRMISAAQPIGLV